MPGLRIATWIFAALAAAVLVLALLVAIVLPYGEWDAMSFGTWSRLIAEHWPHLRFANVGEAAYHRPLFYVLQGWIWGLFGFHPALGRVLSLLFTLVLLASVAWMAARSTLSDRKFAAALAVVVLLLAVPLEHYAAAGLSDVPAAAMVAATGALLLARRLGRARLPLVAVASTLSVLAKPSALPALVGLAAAVLLGPRLDLGRRALAAGAIAAGVCLGLTYDIVQARYVHTSLLEFLTTGTTNGFYAQLADASRRRVLLDGSWLGGNLRVLLAFGIFYAVTRLFIRHRPAVAIAVPVAVLWSWLGPHLAGSSGFRVGLLGSGDWLQQTAVLVLAASLLLALAAPEGSIPDRLQLARVLVWALPPLVVWALRVVYDNRLLAPAWPPLVLLIVLALLPAFHGARVRREWLVAVPTAAVVVLGAYAANDINGLGSSGWRQLRAAGISGVGDAAEMRGIGLGGDFASEVNALAPQVRRTDRILTFDGRLSYFYLSQIDYQPPRSCDQLQGHRVFVLLESDEMHTLYGRRADPAFWQSCPRSLTKVDERAGAYAVFVAGMPTTAQGGCEAPPAADQLAVEFGHHFPTAAAAAPFLKHVISLGFVEARIDELGCANYRVVETGIPSSSVGTGIVAKAKTARLTARLVNG